MGVYVNLLERTCVKFHDLEISETDKNLTIWLNIYFYKRSVRKKDPNEANFTFSKKLYTIKLDKKAGITTLSKGKETVNLKDYWSQLQEKWIDDMYGIVKLKTVITSLLFKARNILDIDPSYFNGENFPKIFLFVEHPNLQYLGTHRVNHPDDEYLSLIDSAKGKIDMFYKLIGHKSKKVIEKCSNPYVFNLFLRWGKWVEHSENLINLVDELNFQYLGRRDFFDFRYEEDFIHGIDLIKRFHKGQEEKIWMHRLIKAVKNGNYGATPFALDAYVLDIGEMYHMVKIRKPDYLPVFDGDIRHLHDTLAADQRKLTNPNLTIPYQEKERQLEKKLDETVEFALAPDTHYLIEVGAKMNLCVGSYGSRAFHKQCNIIVLKERNEPVVCIEVRENQMIQAKMKYNQRPTGHYREAVIDWNKENGIDYHQCEDIA